MSCTGTTAHDLGGGSCLHIMRINADDPKVEKDKNFKVYIPSLPMGDPICALLAPKMMGWVSVLLL